RPGIRPPQEPLVAKSVAVVDKVIKVETPNGSDFYRYNHDGYGEMDDGRPWNWDGHYSGKGRLWALLAGERGEYELARGEKAEAARRLDAMLGFANEGRMMPEQVCRACALAELQVRKPAPRFEVRRGHRLGHAARLGDGAVHTPRREPTGRPKPRHARHRAAAARLRRSAPTPTSISPRARFSNACKRELASASTAT